MIQLDITIALVALLALSSATTWVWGMFSLPDNKRKLQREVQLRIRAWWIMSAMFVGAWWGGFWASVILFFAVSALALREYITLIDTKRADHRALVLAFVVLTPIQYYLIGIEWYGLFSIFIPVYGFLLVTTRVALSGDCENFLERVAKIQWGLMATVFLVSHAPALLTLTVLGSKDQASLLFFYLVALTELSDVLQFVFGKMFGRRKVAPLVSPNKTVEGLLGGALATGVCAVLLRNLTPFSLWVDFLVGTAICLTGFCGGLVMSAVKRDHGCKDFGTLISGHGGVLDRIDSLCFTAPLFFHFVRYFYTA